MCRMNYSMYSGSDGLCRLATAGERIGNSSYNVGIEHTFCYIVRQPKAVRSLLAIPNIKKITYRTKIIASIITCIIYGCTVV